MILSLKYFGEITKNPDLSIFLLYLFSFFSFDSATFKLFQLFFTFVFPS